MVLPAGEWTSGSPTYKRDTWRNGAKNALLCHVYAKNDHFTQTGSGQT
jgi:hypothetical protein